MKFSGPSPEGWHEIDAKFRCDWEYLARNIRGIEPAGRTETPEALAVGLLLHAARARWFTLGFPAPTESVWTSIIGAVREEATLQKLPITAAAEQKVQWLMTQYIAFWKNQPKPTCIGTEYGIGPVTVLDGLSFTRTARLDDLSRYPEGGSELWIGEAKTTSGTISQLIDEYELAGQTMLQDLLYSRAAQGKALHGPVAGIMLDVIGKPGKYRGKDQLDFQRYPIRITDFQREWFARTMMKHLSEATEMKKQGWDFPAERNPTACLRQVSGAWVIKCQFYDLCKNGRASTGAYQLPGGKSLLDHEPRDGARSMPWS